MKTSIKQADLKNNTKLNPQIQFNKGYWDGAIVIARNTSHSGFSCSLKPFDPFYEAGLVFAVKNYVRGQKADGKWAWLKFQAELTDPNLIFRIQEAR